MLYGATPSPSTTVTVIWLVLGLTTPFVGVASFSLPSLALGANWKRALIIAGLCGLVVFGAVIFFVLRAASTASSAVLPVSVVRAYLLALAALVGTPALGSLLAVRGDERMVSRILPLTLVTALAMYCASLFAFWLYYGQSYGQLFLIPLIVAALSWPVLPGVVAALRSY
jgi:hypothetical protein